MSNNPDATKESDAMLKRVQHDGTQMGHGHPELVYSLLLFLIIEFMIVIQGHIQMHRSFLSQPRKDLFTSTNSNKIISVVSKRSKRK